MPLDLNEIVLKGSTSPTDVALSGELTPKQGRTFIKAIIKRDGLLSVVTVDITGKLKKERSAYDIAKGALTRHISGQAPTEANIKKLGVIGCTLDMTNGVALNAKILDDTLEDNRDNPNFEKEQFENFGVAFNNDLSYLGIVGTSDNSDVTATFVELAKGWVQIAKDSTTTNKSSSSSTSIIDRLKHVVKNLNDDVKGKATIMMSASDYDDYQLEIAEKHQNTSVLLKADAKSFMGYSVLANTDMVNNEYLATILKNMVFGISSKVKRNRWYDNNESALKYKFVVFPDYEFDIHKYVTLITFVALTLSAETKTVVAGADTTVTVTSAANEGIAGVTATTADEAIATTNYDSTTGVITITGVAEGSVVITVDDGTSTKEISVTVTAA